MGREGREGRGGEGGEEGEGREALGEEDLKLHPKYTLKLFFKRNP